MVDRLVVNPAGELRAASGSWWWAYNGRRNADRGVQGYLGHWLVPVKTRRPDDFWQLVADATWSGRLGPYSKTDAFPPVPGHPLLVHVYTADYRDAADLRRVLNGLRTVGFDGELGYFENEAAHLHLGGPLYTALAGSLRLVRHRDPVRTSEER